MIVKNFITLLNLLIIFSVCKKVEANIQLNTYYYSFNYDSHDGSKQLQLVGDLSATYYGEDRDYLSLNTKNVNKQKNTGFNSKQIREIHSSDEFSLPKRKDSTVNLGDHINQSIFQRIFACVFYYFRKSDLGQKGIVKGLCPAWNGCEYSVKPVSKSRKGKTGEENFQVKFNLKECTGTTELLDHYQEFGAVMKDNGNITDLSYIYRRKTGSDDIFHNATFNFRELVQVTVFY